MSVATAGGALERINTPPGLVKALEARYEAELAAARSAYYEKGINAGWMTPNEARELEEMPKLPGLDKPRIPLNYVEVGSENNNSNEG